MKTLTFSESCLLQKENIKAHHGINVTCWIWVFYRIKLLVYRCFRECTLPKTKMDPKKRWFGSGISFQLWGLFGVHVGFGGCKFHFRNNMPTHKLTPCDLASRSSSMAIWMALVGFGNHSKGSEMRGQHELFIAMTKSKSPNSHKILPCHETG